MGEMVRRSSREEEEWEDGGARRVRVDEVGVRLEEDVRDDDGVHGDDEGLRRRGGGGEVGAGREWEGGRQGDGRGRKEGGRGWAQRASLS